MSYQIICAKNRAFWNKIIIFIALFVGLVCVVSMFLPTKNIDNNANSQTTLYQEISQTQTGNINSDTQNNNKE